MAESKTNIEDIETGEDCSEEEKKSRRDMYVSNGLDKKIRIEILPARLVQRTGLREHHVEVGAGVLDPALNLGFTQGSAGLEYYQSELTRQNVAPHDVWRIKPLSKSTKKGKSTMAEACFQVRAYLEVSKLLYKPA